MRRTGLDQRNRENKTLEREKERHSNNGNKNGGERKQERVERNE